MANSIKRMDISCLEEEIGTEIIDLILENKEIKKLFFYWNEDELEFFYQANNENEILQIVFDTIVKHESEVDMSILNDGYNFTALIDENYYDPYGTIDIGSLKIKVKDFMEFLIDEITNNDDVIEMLVSSKDFKKDFLEYKKTILTILVNDEICKMHQELKTYEFNDIV